MSLTYLIACVSWLTGCAIAVALGRRVARLAALLLAAQLFLIACEPFIVRSSNALRPVGTFTDIVLAVVFVVLALRERRQWVAAAAAFQILSVLTHVARVLSPQVRGWAYMTGAILWGYSALAAVVWGAFRERAEWVTNEVNSSTDRGHRT